jgi:hypothetical protein
MSDELNDVDAGTGFADRRTDIDEGASRMAWGTPGREKPKFTDKAADVLDTTGQYLREWDERDLLSDVGELAKRHPGKSLLAAAAIGFFVGRSITRE